LPNIDANISITHEKLFGFSTNIAVNDVQICKIETECNNTQHYDTQHNDTQRSDTQHKRVCM
jgi:hypothetical protein